MRWRKKGLIFRPSATSEWTASHASVPVVDRISDQVLRVYYGARDSLGRSVTTFFEVDADDPSTVLYVHDRAVLRPGGLGAFDDSGAMPSSVVNHEGRKYLFYIGWNRGVTVAYRNAVGLAVSDDGGVTFSRVFEGPIVDRSRTEPFFCASPFAMIDEGLWKLWYASATGFEIVHDAPEPIYQVRYAESHDGAEWRRGGPPCLPYTFPGEANARPSVLKEGDLYRMWFCFRGSVDYRTDPAQSYRLGYAESWDGRSWTRLDELVGLVRSAEGWDSQMVCYPFVYVHGGAKHMLYNGNGFGQTGIGHAILEDDDRSAVARTPPQHPPSSENRP